MPIEGENMRGGIEHAVIDAIGGLSDDAKLYLGEVLRLEKAKLSLKNPQLNKDLADIARRIVT